MHDLPLITTIAAGFTAACVLGLLTQRLGFSSIVGYLLAGVLIGPHTPGITGDPEMAHELAEIGVILLMFGVGLHFHLDDLLAVKNVAIPGAIGQSLAATLLSMLVFGALGMPLNSSAVLGMAMAVASTVVLMRVLMDADVLHSPQGHIAVGWLLVEDILTVIGLVLIPILGTNEPTGEAAAAPNVWATLGIAMLKLVVMVVLLIVVGSRVIPWALLQVARLRSRELFTLTVLVFSIAIAAGAYALFGASMALGAFLAGMVVALSPASHQAAADALPLRDAFAVLFFVSVGMIFDPIYIVREPLMILAALGIILLAKPLAALAIVTILGHSAHTALTVAIGLAQIGEFSFILSDLARREGLMPEEGHNVLVAAAIISITLNPLLFRSIPRIETFLKGYPRLWRLLNARVEQRAAQINATAGSRLSEQLATGRRLAIVVGFGPVGRSVHRLLQEAGLATVVIDLNMDTVSELRAKGQTAVFGDASREAILEQAGIGHASHLILTLPHSSDRAAVVGVARTLSPKVRILVRARYLAEREVLEMAGATAAVFEEAEAAVGLARVVLTDTGANREVMERSVRDLRLQLIRENVSNLHGQRVRSVMVPWTRVQRLLTSSSREEVLRQIGRYHYSRWPVVNSNDGRPVGYLLVKDLIADATTDVDWTTLVRPIKTVRPDDNMEATLTAMQAEGATVCVVEDAGSPVGLITLEDILEQVVGRIEDEYPRDSAVLLHEALSAGNILLDLKGRTPEQAIHELAQSISAEALPPRCDVAELALAREADISTDLGLGVAIPHARCHNLASPLLVFGRSAEGIIFPSETKELVRLVFLLITPSEKPDLQLFLLGQLAKVAGNATARRRLLEASTPSEIIHVLTQQQDSSAAAPVT